MKSWTEDMKKCYLDANTLLYFTNPSSYFHKQATELISLLLLDKWALFISTLTLDEYFHNAIRFSQMSKELALKDLRKGFSRLRKLENISLVHPPEEFKKQLKVLNLMEKYQLKSRDAYHLFIILENKIKFLATFDNDFDEVFQDGRIQKFK